MKKFTLIILVSGFCSFIFAQDSFVELANLPEKKLNDHINIWAKGEYNVDFKNGSVPYCDQSKVELKKVVLVAYTISISNSYAGEFLTGTGNDYFVNSLYDNGVPSLVEVFNNYGIELITYDKMSEDQKALLSASTAKDKILESDLEFKQDKLLSTYEKVEEKGIKAGSAREGYKSWQFNDGLPMNWDLSLYGILTDLMDVDAILFVNNLVQPDRGGLTYNKTLLTLIGRNPFVFENGPQLITFYGAPYAQASINAEFQFATFKKKKIISESYEGFDQVMALITESLLESQKKNKQRSIEKFAKYQEKQNKKKKK